MNFFTKQKQSYCYQKQIYDYQNGNIKKEINQELEINTHTPVCKINNHQDTRGTYCSAQGSLFNNSMIII